MREPLAPLSTARNAPGTRFCQVCNDFRPISQFKKDQNRVCQQHDDVPDPSGVRFCRSCQDLLPLSRFSVDQMRFLCRACTWKRTGKPARMRYRAKRAHSVSETDMDANIVEAANGVTDAADTISDSVSEEAGYMDTGFMNACNMLPDIVALPVCV